jgi:hypothetical protein
MRLSRVTPSSIDELRQQILEDLEVLEPGLRLVACAIPLGGRGTIDVLAADGRGRLAVLTIQLEADCAMMGRSILCWEWLASSQPALRGLIRMDGLDLGLPPRLILAASRFGEEIIAVAGRLARPEVEMIAIDLVQEGDRRGILARRIETPTQATAHSAPDAVLESVPPGQARSLMRRVLEELTHAGPGGELRPGHSRGCVDLHRGDRIVASLIAAEDGLEVRRHDRIDSRRVTTDDECRRAAAFLADSRTASGVGLAGAALTPEEIAEFHSLQGAGESGVSAQPEGSSIGAQGRPDASRGGRVEN